MTTEASDSADATLYPDLRDPRVMVAVARPWRPAAASLWALAARLTRLLAEAREPLIGQIKLAWWRDMMTMLADDPDALPKGEPLLAELDATWGGQAGLDALVDAAEAMLLAEDDDARRDAAESFGARLFALSSAQGGDDPRGRRWGLLWGAVQQEEAAAARALFAAARMPLAARGAFAGDRALLMLDRWAAAIATRDGERRWRSEGALLFRVGLLGR
jgi:phytoene synthase